MNLTKNLLHLSNDSINFLLLINQPQLSCQKWILFLYLQQSLIGNDHFAIVEFCNQLKSASLLEVEGYHEDSFVFSPLNLF